jgi:Domain of unknown function (DUF1648)
MRFKAMAVYLLLIGLSAAQVAYYYPRLPDNVASHFDWMGRPDGWMSKSSFLAFEFGLTVFLAVLFAAVGFGAQIWACAAPRCLREPNGKTDESQASKQAEAVEAMSASFVFFIHWLGAATLVFMLAVFQMAIQANLGPDPVLRHVIPALIAYLAVLALLLALLGVQSWRLRTHLPRPEIPPGTWFPAKRFGWGWGMPICWQGWVAMLVWLAALGGGTLAIFRIEWPTSPIVIFYLFVALMVVVLCVMCWLKGETPRWRWGDRD